MQNTILSKTGLKHRYSASFPAPPLLFAILGTSFIFLWAYLPAFINPYIINDDVRQQLFWMQRWCQPGIYPEDLLSSYARMYVPWGVQGLYYAASFFCSPLYFSNILTGVLYVLTGSLIFLSGNRIGDYRLGLAALCIYWVSPFFLHSMAGGLARGFAAPLLMLYFYGWLCRSRIILGLALLLQSLFIPYIFILCAGASGLGWLGWLIGLNSRPSFLTRISDFIFIGGCFSLLLLWHMQMSKAGFGPLPTYAEMLDNPVYTAQGRFPIIPVPSIFYELFTRPWEKLIPFKDMSNFAAANALIAIAAAALLGAKSAQWKKWHPHLTAIICILFSSVLLSLLAKLILLKLFVPSRYLEYSTALGYCFLLAICLHGIMRQWHKARKWITSILVGIFFVVGIMRTELLGLYDYSPEAALYETVLREIPRHAVIAGNPYLMDNVLTFGQRNVLASYELAHPWNTGYWKKFAPRLQDMLKAYYSGNIVEVIDFCLKYGVEYMVVDRRDFSKASLSGKPMFAPYDSQIKEQVKGISTFALLSEDLKRIVINKNISIVPFPVFDSLGTIEFRSGLLDDYSRMPLER